jgi:GntR family transcriptional regulator
MLPTAGINPFILDCTVPLCYLCSTVFRKPNPSSGVPIYVQLKEQIRHAIETGSLTAGDQLPGIRGLAENLVINPNTVIKVYRELENEGVLEIRHGLGAFVATRRGRSRPEEMRDAQQLVREFVERLKDQGLDAGEIRRLFEAELASEFQRR